MVAPAAAALTPLQRVGTKYKMVELDERMFCACILHPVQ